MANTYTTPNMQLVLPTPSVQVGPTWAQNLNDALTLRVDTHDHTPSNGVKVPTAGLNINADLSFNSNSAILLRGTSYNNNVATLPGTETRTVYVSGGNLFYNNNTGIPVQITSGSNINVGALALNVWQYQAVASNTTILSNASYIYLAISTAAPRIINLPSAATQTAGRFFVFKDRTGQSATNNITIVPNGADTISNAAVSEIINSNYGSIILVCDGASNWNTFREGSPGATPTAPGTVQLAGDLAGPGSTATSPRVVEATTSTQGKIQLGGDLQGTGTISTSPRISSLGGIAGGVSMGSVPATGGASGAGNTSNTGIRLSNTGSSTANAGISVRNNSNTANINIASVNGFNEVRIGDDQVNTRYYGGHRVKTTLVSGSGNYNLDTGGKDYIILCNPSGILQLMLPPGEIGREFIIKDISGTAAINQIQVYNSDGKTIEGVTIGLGSTITLMANYGAWRFVCDGNGNWWVL